MRVVRRNTGWPRRSRLGRAAPVCVDPAQTGSLARAQGGAQRCFVLGTLTRSSHSSRTSTVTWARVTEATAPRSPARGAGQPPAVARDCPSSGRRAAVGPVSPELTREERPQGGWHRPGLPGSQGSSAHPMMGQGRGEAGMRPACGAQAPLAVFSREGTLSAGGRGGALSRVPALPGVGPGPCPWWVSLRGTHR